MLTLPSLDLEFRRCPGVTTANVCCAWVDFIATFVQTAAGTSLEDLQKKKKSVEGLYSFMVESAKVSAEDEPLSEAEGSLGVIYTNYQKWKKTAPAHLSSTERAEYDMMQGELGDNMRNKSLDENLKKLRIARA